MTTARPGSVSSATLRPQDLLEAFASCLKELDKEVKHADLITEAYDFISVIETAEYQEDTTQAYEDANEIIAELVDALNDYAPEGYYFGTDPNTPDEKGWLPIEEDE